MLTVTSRPRDFDFVETLIRKCEQFGGRRAMLRKRCSADSVIGPSVCFAYSSRIFFSCFALPGAVLMVFRLILFQPGTALEHSKGYEDRELQA